ncbi:MAG: glutamate--cysteine ligase [Myxococcaceae bacterium]
MTLDRAPTDVRTLSSVEDLVDGFRTAEKPSAQFRVGLEHERFIYPRGSSQPVAYPGPKGIGALLGALEPAGYQPFREGPEGPLIALTKPRLTVSLEPGGQVELSGSPFRTAREADVENQRNAAELRTATASLGLVPACFGYRPWGTTAEMPWMPKARYAAMRETLGKRGRLALDMMLMTCTTQVSLDWADEADCARKVTLAARLAPVLLALYANSPLVNGKPAGYQSYRSRVWNDVDPARCGYFPALLDGSFSYRAYVEWALDAPLLFLRRNGRYESPALTFRALLADGWDGTPALVSDWADHLSTLFPEVRIKSVLEVRSADCGSALTASAMAALWRGLLYDSQALEDAGRLLPKLSFSEHLAFHAEAQRLGLHGTLRGTGIGELAKDMVRVAKEGLRRLDERDAPLLEPLEETAASGRSPADRLLAAFAQDPSPSSLLAVGAL